MKMNFLKALILLTILPITGCGWDGVSDNKDDLLEGDLPELMDTDGDTVPDSQADTTKAPLGAQCSLGSDCQSGNCIANQCAKITDSGGGNELGGACKVNADCKSFNCVNSTCANAAAAGKQVGEECSGNTECLSQICTGGLCAAAQTSTLKQNDDDCQNGKECQSGQCTGGKCAPKPASTGGSDGKPCTTNADCANKLCVNHQCVSNEGDTQPINTTTTAGGATASGKNCTRNAECESGLCKDGKCSDDCALSGCTEPYHVCRYNKCIPVSTIGKECSAKSPCGLGQYCCNGFCSKNKCEVGIACTDNGEECNGFCNPSNICSCLEQSECGNGAYCDYDTSYGKICYYKKQITASCHNDFECESGHCNGESCVQKLDMDAPCRRSNTCKSGRCEQVSEYSDNGHVCNNNYVNCYCKPLGKLGAHCQYESECETGYCSKITNMCEKKP